MDKKEYAKKAKELYYKPPNPVISKNQKFSSGQVVKIVKPESWFAKKLFKENSDALYVIDYSYDQKYGGGNVSDYSITSIITGSNSSWYNESELELLKK